MAIDTARKRRSATLFGLPVPDGRISTNDRLNVCWIYCGISVFTFTPPRMYKTRTDRTTGYTRARDRADIVNRGITDRIKSDITDRIGRN